MIRGFSYRPDKPVLVVSGDNNQSYELSANEFARGNVKADTPGVAFQLPKASSIGGLMCQFSNGPILMPAAGDAIYQRGLMSTPPLTVPVGYTATVASDGDLIFVEIVRVVALLGYATPASVTTVKAEYYTDAGKLEKTSVLTAVASVEWANPIDSSNPDLQAIVPSPGFRLARGYYLVRTGLNESAPYQWHKDPNAYFYHTLDYKHYIVAMRNMDGTALAFEGNDPGTWQTYSDNTVGSAWYHVFSWSADHPISEPVQDWQNAQTNQYISFHRLYEGATNTMLYAYNNATNTWNQNLRAIDNTWTSETQPTINGSIFILKFGQPPSELDIEFDIEAGSLTVADLADRLNKNSVRGAKWSSEEKILKVEIDQGDATKAITYVDVTFTDDGSGLSPYTWSGLNSKQVVVLSGLSTLQYDLGSTWPA
jgi:hypothetical protein